MTHYVMMCDYGLDDAVATVYLLDHLKKGDRVDIMPIGGNSEVSVAHANAHTLLAAYEGDKSGVRIIDTRMLTHPWAKLPGIHGEDGMGDVLPRVISDLPVIDYAEWKKECDDIYLISLGPCTLTEDIIHSRNVTTLLIMGGNVSEEPNFHGYEFNHYLDIKAFNACVKAPHVVATLDTCRVPKFNYIDKRRPEDTLFGRLVNAAIRLAAARHPDNCYIYDFIAVHYAVEPELFDVVPATDIENNALNLLRVKE